MTTLYPGTIQTFVDPAGTATLSSPDHTQRHIDESDTIEAIQTVIGTTAGTSVLKSFAAGDFPARINSTGVLQQTLQGTINNSVIGTPAITGGTITSLIGTSQITGGTVSAGLIGTSTIVGGTVNSVVMGTPTVTGGTFGKPTINAYLDTPQSYTGTASSTTTLNLALSNEHKVTMPNAAGSLTLAVTGDSIGQKFIVAITQGTAGSGTVGWFSTIRWDNGVTPTLTTTASKRDVMGFIVTGTATYDGFIVGQNI